MIRGRAAWLMAFVCVWSTSTLAQTGADNASIGALLSEVRQLRLAVERATSVGPRMQIALQRIQIQQEHVDRVSRQLEEFRDQMTKSQAEDVRMATQVKEAESRVSQEQDPSRRKLMEEAVQGAKALMEQQGIRDAQQRTREADLASRFQNEQARLNELNEQLNSLERTLAALAPKQP